MGTDSTQITPERQVFYQKLDARMNVRYRLYMSRRWAIADQAIRGLVLLLAVVATGLTFWPEVSTTLIIVVALASLFCAAALNILDCGRRAGYHAELRGRWSDYEFWCNKAEAGEMGPATKALPKLLAFRSVFESTEDDYRIRLLRYCQKEIQHAEGLTPPDGAEATAAA